MKGNLRIMLGIALAGAGLAFALTQCGSGSSSGGYGSYGSGGMTSTASTVEVVACPTSGATAVAIADYSFTPASVSIASGGIVEWTNTTSGTTHTVTSTTVPAGGTFDNTVNPGTSLCLKFTSGGTYDYHCSIHPSMTGTVVVGSTTGSTTSGGGTTGTGGGYTY